MRGMLTAPCTLIAWSGKATGSAPLETHNSLEVT
jgi:hypothetical protein